MDAKRKKELNVLFRQVWELTAHGWHSSGMKNLEKSETSSTPYSDFWGDDPKENPHGEF